MIDICLKDVDMPGHAYSWGKGYPEIITNCVTSNENNVPLNPIPEKTYEVILVVSAAYHLGYQWNNKTVGGSFS
jgi:hypothetical protein